MSNFSSNALAAIIGAAIGAGVTYAMLKDKEEFQETCEKGMQAIDNVFDELEEGIDNLIESIKTTNEEPSSN